MLKNYLKTVIRQAITNRLNTSIIITLFVANELIYDKFHNNFEKIYRITTHEVEEGIKRDFAHSYLTTAPLLASSFPQIKEAVRLLPYDVTITNQPGKAALHENDFYFADSNFFRVFDFG